PSRRGGTAHRWWEGSSAGRGGSAEAPAPACASAPAASARAGTHRSRCEAAAPSGTASRSSPHRRWCPSPPGPPPTGRRERAASPPPGRCDRPRPPPRPRARCSSASRRSRSPAHQLLTEEVQRRAQAVVPGVLLLEPVPLVQGQQVPHRPPVVAYRPDDLLGLALGHPGVVLPLLHVQRGADLVRRLQRRDPLLDCPDLRVPLVAVLGPAEVPAVGGGA